MPKSKPDLRDLPRRYAAAGRRAHASATFHAKGPYAESPANTDEENFALEGYPANFTKGLPHQANGTAQQGYDEFTDAINLDNGMGANDVSFADVPTGAALFKSQRDDGEEITWRGWESPRTGHYFDLQGPDADAFGMAPAPNLGSAELTAEMAEVYAMALLRDVPFAEIEDETGEDPATKITVKEVLATLNNVAFFNTTNSGDPAYSRRRQSARLLNPGADYDVDSGISNAALPPLSGANLFRGSGPGAKEGPWVSQFMLLGNDVNGCAPKDGQIAYGSQLIDQRTRTLSKGVDFMTNWEEWMDVQNGANLGDFTTTTGYRYITTPRDIATYVRFDALYQAYLNACLVLLGVKGVGFQLGFPDKSGTPPKGETFPRTGFAAFGPPHILSLVTEVATRCLKFARRQKFNWHRRARPEKISGLLTLAALDGAGGADKLGQMTQAAASSMVGDLGGMTALIHKHNQHRETANHAARPFKGTQPPWLANSADGKNLLLAMAFAEGSPMHPAYAAGHATVAGGCVTMLKAFFQTLDEHEDPLPWDVTKLPIVEAKPDKEGSHTSKLCDVTDHRKDHMTLEGELNKLAANISIARNMAGVHFYSDYYDSLRMGERVAVGILVEQMRSYDEPVTMVFRSFDAEVITISTEHPDEAKIDGALGVYSAWMQRPQKGAGGALPPSALVASAGGAAGGTQKA